MSEERTVLKHTPASPRAVNRSVYAVLIASCLLCGLAYCIAQALIRHKIAQRVRSLGPAGFGTSFGEINFSGSENSDYVIRRGKASVPYLVEVLNGTEPVNVGYAAYCLKEIGAADGKVAAETALSKLKQKSDLNSFERLAIRLLTDYLKSIAPPDSH